MVLEKCGAHAAIGRIMFVYYGPQKAVLITTLEEELIRVGIYKN